MYINQNICINTNMLICRRVTSYVSITLFLCAFWNIASETSDGNSNCRKKYLLIHKKSFYVCLKPNVNDGRWKRTCWIHFTCASKQPFDFALWDGIIRLTSGPIFLHSIWNVVMVIQKCPSQVCCQVFLLNCLAELFYMTAFPNRSHPPPKAI